MIKNRRLIILFASASLLITAVKGVRASGDNPGMNPHKHYLGVAASTLSGMGLSYGCIFHPDYMFRICGLYMESDEKRSGYTEHIKDIWWNTGAEVQRFLFIIPSGNVTYTGYALAGGNYRYSKHEDPAFPLDNDLDRQWTAGMAMGLRVLFYERIALNIEFGYQYGRDITEETRNTGLAGGAAAHFAF